METLGTKEMKPVPKTQKFSSSDGHLDWLTRGFIFIDSQIKMHKCTITEEINMIKAKTVL